MLLHKEQKNILLFTALYYIQGVALGLFPGTIQLLLGDKITISEMTLFSLANYPFSFKIVTAPLLETYYIKFIGKRRTYIFICQYLIVFLYFGAYYFKISEWIQNHGIYALALYSIIVKFLAANQDVSVDGWVLTAFSQQIIYFIREYVHLGAQCQTIGQLLGIVASTTLFITVRDIISLEEFILFNGVLILAVNFYIHLYTREIQEEESESLSQVWQKLMQVIKNKSIQRLCIYLMVFRIATQPIYASLSVELQQKGLTTTMIAWIQTLIIPFSLVLPFFIHVKQGQEMDFAKKIYLLKYVDAFLSIYLMKYSSLGIFELFPIMLFSSSIQNALFVSHSGYFNRIADPDIGGTYLTLINSVHNLGNSLTSTISLLLIEYLSLDFVIYTSLIVGVVLYIRYSKSVLQLQNYNNNEFKIIKLD